MRSQLTFATTEVDGEFCSGQISERAGEWTCLGRDGEQENDRLVRFATGS